MGEGKEAEKREEIQEEETEAEEGRKVSNNFLLRKVNSNLPVS